MANPSTEPPGPDSGGNSNEEDGAPLAPQESGRAEPTAPKSAYVPSKEPNLFIIPLSGEQGTAATSKLARWLARHVEQVAAEIDCKGERPGTAELLADAHFALSGGLWLQRAHRVSPERFRRFKLVEAVRVASSQAEVSLNAALPDEEVPDDLVRRYAATLATTIFWLYFPDGVKNFFQQDREVHLLNAVDAVRGKGSQTRWEALARLTTAMGLGRTARGEETPDPDDLRTDVARIGRMLKKFPLAYPLLPAGVSVSWTLVR